MEVTWGQVDSYSEVQSVNGLTGKVQLKIPTKTSDLTNDSGFITEVSGDYATKDDLTKVQNKIPDVSGFATKTEVEDVEAKIPNVEGFATQTELEDVKASIPDTTGLATKAELTTVEKKIPTTDTFATKLEVATVEDAIPDVSNFIIRTEMDAAISNVENKIPDVSGFATKSEIPATYLKSATVADNKLTITDATGTNVEFAGGSETLVVKTDGESMVDKTYAQLLEAYNNGQPIKMIVDGMGIELPFVGYIAEEGYIFPAGFNFVLAWGQTDDTQEFWNSMVLTVQPDDSVVINVTELYPNNWKTFVINCDGQTADKTYDEILSAYNNGRTLVMNQDDMGQMPLICYTTEEGGIFPAGFTFGIMMAADADGTYATQATAMVSQAFTIKPDNTLYSVGAYLDLSSVGGTSVDLSSYSNTTEVQAMINNTINTMIADGEVKRY